MEKNIETTIMGVYRAGLGLTVLKGSKRGKAHRAFARYCSKPGTSFPYSPLAAPLYTPGN